MTIISMSACAARPIRPIANRRSRWRQATAAMPISTAGAGRPRSRPSHRPRFRLDRRRPRPARWFWPHLEAWRAPGNAAECLPPRLEQVPLGSEQFTPDDSDRDEPRRQEPVVEVAEGEFVAELLPVILAQLEDGELAQGIGHVARIAGAAIGLGPGDRKSVV